MTKLERTQRECVVNGSNGKLCGWGECGMVYDFYVKDYGRKCEGRTEEIYELII